MSCFLIRFAIGCYTFVSYGWRFNSNGICGTTLPTTNNIIEKTFSMVYTLIMAGFVLFRMIQSLKSLSNGNSLRTILAKLIGDQASILLLNAAFEVASCSFEIYILIYQVQVVSTKVESKAMSTKNAIGATSSVMSSSVMSSGGKKSSE
jgi:hypothetical protein